MLRIGVVVGLVACFHISLQAQELSKIPDEIIAWQKAAQDSAAQNNISGAVDSYQKIQQSYPNTVYAVEAQKSIILNYLRQNQTDNALAALAQMAKTYSSHPDYVSQAEEIINSLTDANQKTAAQEFSQSLLERFPDDPRMLGVLQRKARNEVWMKRIDLADATVKSMQKYAAHPQYAEMMSWAAYEYRRAGYYPQATQAYEAVLTQNPAGVISLRCSAGLVLVDIGLGDAAKAAQDSRRIKTSLLSCREYFQTTELEEAINALADAGQPAAAREICQAVVEQFTDTPQLLWIWQRKARCEVFMRQFSLADETVKVMQKYAAQPDYADALNWTAYEYRRAGDFDGAWNIYNSIMAVKPNEIVQLRSIAGLILSDVGLEETGGIAKDVQRMKTAIQACRNYVRISEVEDAINTLVDAGQAEAASEICQTITEHYPDTPDLMWIWQRKARSEVIAKKYEMVDESAKKMQAYSAHPQYAEALSWTAYECCKAGYYQKAIELGQMVLDQKGTPEDHIRCLASQARAYARLGQEDKVQANVEKLLSQYGKDNPDSTASYLFGVGEEYYSMAFTDNSYSQRAANSKDIFEKAITLWQTIPALACNAAQQAETSFFIGMALMYSDNYPAAVERYEKTLQQWPDYAKNGNILRITGTCYAAMAEKKIGDTKAALQKAEECWSRVIRDYPDALLSHDAAVRLAVLKENQQQWKAVADAYEFYLARCGNDGRKNHATFKLGWAYEQTGQTELAQAAYCEYLRNAPAGDKYVTSVAKGLLRLEGAKK